MTAKPSARVLNTRSKLVAASKEQLKKIGGMEFYDVGFSYRDRATLEETFVSVPEQGGATLIPEGHSAPGIVYTAAHAMNGSVGLYRLELQTIAGNGS